MASGALWGGLFHRLGDKDTYEVDIVVEGMFGRAVGVEMSNR